MAHRENKRLSTRWSTLSDFAAFKIFAISSLEKGSVGFCFSFGPTKLTAWFSSTIFRCNANLKMPLNRSNLFDAVNAPTFHCARNSVSASKSKSLMNFIPRSHDGKAVR